MHALKKKESVEAKYVNEARIGNFFTRWYYDLVGTSLVYRKTLILFDNGRYKYSYRGGECGTFDEDRTGAWRKEGEKLLLKSDNIFGNATYIMKSKFLLSPVDSLNTKDLLFKKVR